MTAAALWNKRERVGSNIDLSFNILLAHQTQNFHEENTFIASVKQPGWACVISFYRLLPVDTVT